MKRLLSSLFGFGVLLPGVFWLATLPPLPEPEERTGIVHLTTIDSSTEKRTPARVEVRGSDGSFHVADDALRVGVVLKNDEQPLRVDDLDAYLGTLRQRVYNGWTRSAQFYTSGDCRLTLPAGTYDISVFKGIEYEDASTRIDVEPDQDAAVEMRLSRWVNQPAQGWYSSDAHLHIPRPTSELNPHFLSWMQAEDIHVANLLQWGHSHHFNNAIQYAHGDPGVYTSEGFVLASGQENPRTRFLGHTIVLGTRRPIHLPDEYLPYRRAFEQARKQGTVNGYAHYGVLFGAQNGLALDLPQGLVDFIEVLQHNIADYSVWYSALNLGFRLAPLAGTDYPVGPIPGWERFYAKVDGTFSFSSWLDSVRRGRVFVTNGPLLEFQAGGAEMGQQLLLEQAADIWVEGSVRFDPQRDQVERLELVFNGEVVSTLGREGEAPEISFRIRRRVDRAGWFALRASGRKEGVAVRTAFTRQPLHSGPALAHSSPVYIDIVEQPTLQQSPEGRSATWSWLARLREFESVIRSRRIREIAEQETSLFMDGVSLEMLRSRRSALLEAIAESERRYLERMKTRGSVKQE